MKETMDIAITSEEVQSEQGNDDEKVHSPELLDVKVIECPCLIRKTVKVVVKPVSSMCIM